ncbi:MAG TPA: methionine ABC transporter ATP-binding protein [Inquilinus sp.]|nr:methionine ABC transporter ATP-binding protein [Inquilinus sp.]
MIRLDSVSKTFHRAGQAQVAALADVSLTVERGEIFGVIGPSGAGKSTLIRLVNLLERPTAGTVTVDGTELTALPEAALRAERRKIGMIFQDFALLSSRTVFGNVALPLELAGLDRRTIAARVDRLLELVGLTDKRDRYPAELSGGQKQRVGIARALANEPAVLLCDEATSALDPETTASILQLLAKINRELGLTIVLITHEMAVIKAICHRVAVLEHGRVIEQARVFDLFTRPQTATSRAFVASVTGAELPEALAARLSEAPLAGGETVLRLVFAGSQAGTTAIGQLARRLGVDAALLHGRVDSVQGAPFGTLIVSIPGGPEMARPAIDFLTSLKLSVEVLGHVPATLRAVG